MDNQVIAGAPIPVNNDDNEQSTINAYQVAAEEFNKIFSAALSELDVSRKVLQERARKIAELDESIRLLDSRLEEEREKARAADEKNFIEGERLNQIISDLESERDWQKQKLSEQESVITGNENEVRTLTESIEEKSRCLEEHIATTREMEAGHAREKDDYISRINSLQADYDSTCASMQEFKDRLEEKNREVEDLAGKSEEILIEHERLKEDNQQQKDAHLKVVEKLAEEVENLKVSLQQSEALLQEKSDEVQDKSNSIAALEQDISGLKEEIDTQAGIMRSEAEQYYVDREELNANITRLTAELAAAKTSHKDITAHAETLEQLNRALHDSSISESELHKRAVGEKENLINVLKDQLDSRRKNEGDEQVGAGELEDLQVETERLQNELSASEKLCEKLQAKIHELDLSATSADGQAPAGVTYLPATGMLTGRKAVVSHLDDVLADNDSQREATSIMYVLLDDFVQIRNELGIFNSEHLLAQAMEFIHSTCDPEDMVARFGDCTFVVLCKDSDLDHTQEKANRILSSVEQNIFEVDGRSMVMTVSIGVDVVRNNDKSAKDVISRVDTACEIARTTGGNQVLVNSNITEDIQLCGENANHAEFVDNILREKRLKIYYQPISSLKNAVCNYYEVLTRVEDENGDTILPGEFFAMAGSTNKAVEVDRHIIQHVMSVLSNDPDKNKKMFIKLSRQSVADQGLPAWVENMIGEMQVNAEQLVFEVSEYIMGAELKNVSMLSETLKNTGCQVAIEHYQKETGEQHLRHINADYLKIDGGLVQNLGNKTEYHARAREIVNLSMQCNLATIAEGVENPASLAILYELGVDYAQGYLIQPPSSDPVYNIEEITTDDEPVDAQRAVFNVV